MRSIEECYHNDSAKVVCYSEGCKKDLESERNPCLEACKHAKRECDISSHRDGKTSLHCRISRAEKVEHQNRNDHTTAGTDDRKKCLIAGRKLSDLDLTLDFKTYRQEKDSHQKVVDHGTKRHCMSVMAEEIEVSDRETYSILPKAEIPVLDCRNVRADKRCDCKENKYGT